MGIDTHVTHSNIRASNTEPISQQGAAAAQPTLGPCQPEAEGISPNEYPWAGYARFDTYCSLDLDAYPLTRFWVVVCGVLTRGSPSSMGAGVAAGTGAGVGSGVVFAEAGWASKERPGRGRIVVHTREIRYLPPPPSATTTSTSQKTKNKKKSAYHSRSARFSGLNASPKPDPKPSQPKPG